MVAKVLVILLLVVVVVVVVLVVVVVVVVVEVVLAVVGEWVVNGIVVAWWVTDVKLLVDCLKFASEKFEVVVGLLLTFASRQILVPGRTLRQLTFSAFLFITSFKLGVTSSALVVSYFITLLMAFGSFICNGSLTSALADTSRGNFPERKISTKINILDKKPEIGTSGTCCLVFLLCTANACIGYI